VNRRERPGGRLAVRAARLALVVAVVSSCATGEAKERYRREADVQVAVLRIALENVPAKSVRPLVFVSPLEGGKPFPLEVQAAVIDHLSKQAEVKFVDEQAEAIDANVEGKPVLGGGVMFSLGRVPPSGNVFEVSGQRYRTAADRTILRFSARATADGWVAELLAEEARPPDR
jgi:hypothetical protein